MAKSYKTQESVPKSRKSKSVISEPVTVYRKSIYRENQTGRFNEHLAGTRGMMTTTQKMEISKGGITKKELELLKTLADLDYTTIARILSVTRATLINKRKTEKFNTALSERIVGLADLYTYGIKVFGEKEIFNRWMNEPNRALGGKTPLDIIDNQFGREEVKNVIGRIEYGVYS